MSDYPGMTVRPYEVVLAICAADDEHAAADARAREILDAVRAAPEMPIALRCNAGGAFAYQACGTEADTPEGDDLNVYRDIEILMWLNAAPGAVLPARIVFNRLLEQVEDIAVLWGDGKSEAWPACPEPLRTAWARVREQGIGTVFAPRTEDEMAADKAKSIAAMKTADAVDSRPHILVCSICQYGNGVRPPFAEDNLPELIQLMLAEPETRIRLVPYADWMMCAPCPYRAAGTNVCIHNRGSGGLPNQMRDLRVLRRLGLTFGTVMNACELYRMILECIPGNAEICAIPHGAPSVWYSGCGTITEDTENYLKGREELMALLG